MDAIDVVTRLQYLYSKSVPFRTVFISPSLSFHFWSHLHRTRVPGRIYFFQYSLYIYSGALRVSLRLYSPFFGSNILSLFSSLITSLSLISIMPAFFTDTRPSLYQVLWLRRLYHSYPESRLRTVSSNRLFGVVLLQYVPFIEAFVWVYLSVIMF